MITVRDFAVVAAEVRRLAENSSQFVSEIAALNQDISTYLNEILGKTQNTQQAVAQNAIYAQETAINTREQEHDLGCNGRCDQ